MRTFTHDLLLRFAAAGRAPVPDDGATAEVAKETVENASFSSTNLLPAAIIFGVAIAIGMAARFVVEKLVNRRSEILGRLAGHFAMFIIVSVGLFYALARLDIRLGPLIGALGIGGFALAFALRDTLENLISGVILQVRQPFDYKDTVELGDYSGTVTNIDLRAVTMTVFSGEHVILPSKDVLQNPIENWTHNPTKRIDVPIGVAYGTDIERACRVIADGLAHVDGALDAPAPDCVFSGFGESSIDLIARVWYPSNGAYFEALRRTARSVQSSLERAGIEIPFPTRTLLTSPEAVRRHDEHQAA